MGSPISFESKQAAAPGLRPLFFSNPKPIAFFPEKTLPLSASGNKCDLNCKHCQGHYLKNMLTIKDLKQQIPSKIKSILVSGGSDSNGLVYSLTEANYAALAKKYSLNVHRGITTKKDLRLLEKFADTVSIDLHGDNEVIKNILNLEYSYQDFFNSYLLLRENLRTVPHLLIGLGRNFNGENKVIDFLTQHPPSALVLLVYRPGGSLGGLAPPLKVLIPLLAEIRAKLANIPLIMGCMRPGGIYRQQLDQKIIDLGFNGIVNPAIKLKNPIISQECCGLWQW